MNRTLVLSITICVCLALSGLAAARADEAPLTSPTATAIDVQSTATLETPPAKTTPNLAADEPTTAARPEKAVDSPPDPLAIRPGDPPTTLAATFINFRYFGAHGAKTIESSPVVRVKVNEFWKNIIMQPGADWKAVAQRAAKEFPDTAFDRTGPVHRGGMQDRILEESIFKLEIGEISPVTPSSYGFFVSRREPVVQVRHILIAYKGAARALPDRVKRTREEARRLAEQVREETLKPGADFPALARKSSDAPDREAGGYVGFLDRGLMIKVFEDTAFGLEVGEISPVIETRFGFHIVKRIG